MNDTRVLCFHLGDELFAMEIAAVREILQLQRLCAVPLMPAFVRGVMNLRGAVVPVIDLQAWLGRAPGRIGKKTCIVVVEVVREGERAEFGLLVDAVSEVLELPADAQEAPPPFGLPVAGEHVLALARTRGRLVTVLQPASVLDLARMAECCEAAAPLETA